MVGFPRYTDCIFDQVFPEPRCHDSIGLFDKANLCLNEGELTGPPTVLTCFNGHTGWTEMMLLVSDVPSPISSSAMALPTGVFVVPGTSLPVIPSISPAERPSCGKVPSVEAIWLPGVVSCQMLNCATGS